MRAITFKKFGGSDVLTIADIPTPKPNPEQLLVRVKATALNRADILQRQGNYAPPPGESDILGLEIAGEVVALGDKVTDFKIGDRVFGLVGSGGYAEYCVIDHKMAMTIPTNFSFIEAAAIPEAFLTANEAIFRLGNLQANETILIHAGASGVGTAGIQLAREIGATVFATVGSSEKQTTVKKLGASAAFNYKEQDFLSEIQHLSNGVDVIIDFIGKKYFENNLKCLKLNGRLICVGLLSGTKSEIDLGRVLTNRLQIKGLTMRAQSLLEKRAITERFKNRWLELLATGKIQPVIDSVFSFQDIQKAHEHMESNANVGKIILEI